MSRQELLVLGWHNVDPTWCFPARRAVGVRGFRAQLEAVTRVGTVVDLGRGISDLRAGRPLPRRAVALTFDDGYRDNLTHAVPVLRDLGLTATFFLTPGILSRETTPWWEQLGLAFATTVRASLQWDGVTAPLATSTDRRRAYETVSEGLKRLDERGRRAAVEHLVDVLEPGTRLDADELFLDWDGARALVRHGMTVGAHGLVHEILANETPDVQRRNLARARGAVEHALDVPVRLVAYPNGTHEDFDDVTERAAAEAGFAAAVTTIPGWNSAATPPYRLRRYVLAPERARLAFKPLVRDAFARVPATRADAA